MITHCVLLMLNLKPETQNPKQEPKTRNKNPCYKQSNIKGICMNNIKLLSNQYADDMWVALDPQEDNLNHLLDELEHFSKFSDLIINYDKSTAFTLGPLRDSDARYYTMKKLFWSDGPVKILGVHIHPDWDVMLQHNYYDELAKMKSILNNWTNRLLSLPGKIVIISSLISSLLVQISFHPIPR